tara:strand:- start:1274 stop:1474 length:201 start_codon:yes stop_codon:yes gene_type:complete
MSPREAAVFRALCILLIHCCSTGSVYIAATLILSAYEALAIIKPEQTNVTAIKNLRVIEIIFSLLD